MPLKRWVFRRCSAWRWKIPVNGMIACKAARMRSIVVPSAEMAADPRWSLADYRLSSLQRTDCGYGPLIIFVAGNIPPCS